MEGLTLEERLRKGPIPIDEALDICRQIADGLETAHDKGVIHRDLKPANVKITPEGKVKVLDFGLAKALHRAGGIALQPRHRPTITEPMTAPGVDPRDGGLHESGAGQGQDRGQADGHLGLRLRAV